MSIPELLASRISSDHFDPAGTVSEDEIRALIDAAREAPSSFNIQFTRFLAVTDPALREAMKAAAWGQAKITNASVAFVLLGDTKAHEDFAVRIRAAGAAGHLPVEIAERVAGMALGMYGNAAFQREECLRSAGLSGMTLLMRAQEMGLASCPMIGFDPEGFRKALGIPDRYFPTMLIVVGRPAAGNARKQRLGVDELLRINTPDFPV